MKNTFEEGNKLYSDATSLREEGHFEKAIALYEEALAILTPIVNAPLRICLLYDMALALDFAGKSKLAIRTFEQSLQLFSDLKRVCPQDEAINNLEGLVEQIAEQLDLARLAVGSEDSNYISYIRARPWSKENMPVLVYIDTSEENGYETELAEFVWGGFLIWVKDDISIKIERTDKEKQAHIKVFRVGDKLGPAAGQTLFEDDTDSDGKVWLTNASISMYSSSRSKAELSSIEKDKLFSLACHEAGHALGLDGHSPYGSDLMYFKSPKLEPSARDFESLKLLYA